MAKHRSSQEITSAGGAQSTNGAAGVIQDAFDSIAAEIFVKAMQNAVTAQQEGEVTRAAAVDEACSILMSLGANTPPKSGGAQKSAPAGASGNANENVAALNTPVLASLDPQLADTVNTVRGVPSPQVSAAGNNAQQMVALSAALAVQDASDALRAMSTISEVIASVSVAKFLESGDEKPLLGVTAAHDLMKAAIEEFAAISAAAATALKEFSPN